MEEYIDIQFPEEKKIPTIIDGNKYSFNAFFSFSDYEIVIGELEKGDYRYKDIVAEVVLNHNCEGDIEKITASMLPDELLDRYIDEVVKDSERIRSIYADRAYIEDVYERFTVSVKEYLNNEIDAIKERVANIKLPKISIPKCFFQQPAVLRVSKEIFNIKPLIPDMSIISDSLAKLAKSFENTQEIVNNIIESFQQIIEVQRPFIAEIAKNATKVLSQLPFLSFSNEEIAEMRLALQRWGEYGWSIPGNAKFNNFLKKPASIKDANCMASKYCNKEYMQKVFEETKGFSIVKKSDYSEAIDDYMDKRYKSCVCILFSLMDARLIRMQTEKEEGKLKYRDVGIKAVDKSKNKMLSETDIEDTFFSVLRFENVYACLGKIYENGKNFVTQPEVINRNFLAHGMLIRRVTQRDCNQLFLLYYNWLSLLERH